MSLPSTAVASSIAVTQHSGSARWPDRSSISNFTYNHISHFAPSNHAFAKGGFLGGTQPDPKPRHGRSERNRLLRDWVSWSKGVDRRELNPACSLRSCCYFSRSVLTFRPRQGRKKRVSGSLPSASVGIPPFRFALRLRAVYSSSKDCRSNRFLFAAGRRPSRLSPRAQSILVASAAPKRDSGAARAAWT